MSEKKYVKKSFWIHQYEKEEVFLREMRKKGWRFVRLYKGIPTKYEFEACEPEDYIYQIDYIETENDTLDYHQLYKDAGWDEIMPWFAIGGSWYYFCRKVNTNEDLEERIYTDNDSKAELIHKLWKRYAAFMLLCGVMEVGGIIAFVKLLSERSVSLGFEIAAITGIVIFSAIILFIVYQLGSIFSVKQKMEKQKSKMI